MTELPTWLTYAVAIGGPIGAIGGLAGVSALVKARAERKKLSAEAEKVEAETDKVDADTASQLTDVALRLVQPLSAELQRLTTEHATTKARVGQLESDARTQHMLLVEHSVWDHLALARLRDAGVDMAAIPPLFPPKQATAPSASEVSTEVTVAVTTAAAEPAT